MVRRGVLSLLAVPLLASALLGAESPRPGGLSYEELMKLPRAKRGNTFKTLSPQNKADVVRTHLQRWLDSHKDSLSQKQKDLIADNLALVAPDLYRDPTPLALQEKSIELYRRAEEIFSREQMLELFTLEGAYVPPQEPKPESTPKPSPLPSPRS